MKDFILNGFRGFCMALADSVPGVSGGTIAFILGFYDKFIQSLDKLAYGKWTDKKEAITFLFKILIGWGFGMAIAVLVLGNLFETKIYEISSLFLGLILFSIPLIWKEEKKNLVHKNQNIIFTIIGMVIVACITYFNPASGGTGMDISQLNIGLTIYIMVAGMIAISAMVLPGISGSTLLLIFGLYVPIISGIKDVLHFSFSSLPALIVFGIGVLMGILLVIKLIKIALEKYRSQTIYCIIGLMIGSLYAIVMGPTTLKVPQEHMTLSTFHVVFFVMGAIVILGLDWMKRKLESHEEK